MSDVSKGKKDKMRRILSFTLGPTMVLVLLIVLGVQFIPGEPLVREQAAASSALQGSGRTLVVTSTADSGPGTLRQKLSEAQSGDKIIFDTTIFPSNTPNTIFLTNALQISQGNITIDASNAGVILDGSNIKRPCIDCLFINSNGNIIQGLRIKNFPAAGILLDNCQNNTIENNLIINNKEDGIKILDNSAYNIITQNSIYNNREKGIDLCNRGNTGLTAPSIIGFDLDAGTLQGHTNCPNCKIEIFSDNNGEGEVYEGQTIADNNGSFNFNKGTSFTKSHITATVTDNEGSTSEFSAPTSGTRRSCILQEGNSLLKTQLQPKQSRELEDNRIGDMRRADIYTEEAAAWFAYDINKLGLKWVRLSIDYFDWNEVESTGEYSEFYIDPNQGKAITALADNAVKIMYCLVFWDEAIQVKKENYSRFKREEEIQRYLDYVQFIVHHFKDRIEYYEILNEPNIGEGTQQYVKVTDYINLVKRTIPIIRQEDPKAKIMAGAVTPLIEPGASDYFFGIISSDLMPVVDAVSWHSHNRYSPEYIGKFYYNYPSLLRKIKEVASSHGFEGEYIAEELHWRTPRNPHPHEPSIYSETVAAKYYARGIVMHLGMDFTVGMAETSHELQLPKMRVIRNLCTIMAGAESTSLPIEIQSEATNIKSYSFSLSNGDHLIALWTDGVAVDEDPGVKATLIAHGFSPQKVMGIDVLNGFEQQLVTSTEEGNLVIRNLLVKDYPIIIRLTDITSS